MLTSIFASIEAIVMKVYECRRCSVVVVVMTSQNECGVSRVRPKEAVLDGSWMTKQRNESVVRACDKDKVAVSSRNVEIYLT